MSQKPNQKIFHMYAIIDGHIISGEVLFSPAPGPGIFTELAKFEAERLLEQFVKQEITAGHI
jgi:hypothetical protein